MAMLLRSQGMMGLPLFLRATSMPLTAFGQVPGRRSGWKRRRLTGGSTRRTASSAPCSTSSGSMWSCNRLQPRNTLGPAESGCPRRSCSA